MLFLRVCIAVLLLSVIPSFGADLSRSVKVTSSLPDRKTALVIGNARYKDSPLRNPVNDAQDIAAKLGELGFKVTLLTNADREEIDKAISQFGRDLKESDVGIFYFSGHGMQVGGTNYLIPVNASIDAEDEIPSKAIDANLILRKMDSAKSRFNIVILDACRNNPFARSFRSYTRGLATMDAPKGSLIVYATSPGSVAADGSGRNGIFTKHLLSNIAAPGIDIEVMMKKVKQGVAEETGERQTPWTLSSLTGEFYFVPGNAKEVTSTPSKDIQKPLSNEVNRPLPPSNPGARQRVLKLPGNVEMVETNRDGKTFFVFTSHGTSTSGDAVSRRIAAQKMAMKKIRSAMISGLAGKPYNLSERRIIELYDGGEVTDLEYVDDGKGVVVKYEVSAY